MRWDYMVMTFDRHGLATGAQDALGAEPPGQEGHRKAIEKYLNVLGAEGWELVAFLPAPQHQEGRWLYHGIFKKEKAA